MGSPCSSGYRRRCFGCHSAMTHMSRNVRAGVHTQFFLSEGSRLPSQRESMSFLTSEAVRSARDWTRIWVEER